MENKDLNNYLNVIKTKKGVLKDVELASSKRKQAWKKQNGKCSKCKKDLKNYFCKYIENPVTKEFSVICSDCAIEIPKRR